MKQAQPRYSFYIDGEAPLESFRAAPSDLEAVSNLLGRSPEIAFRVALRNAKGAPLVIENLPRGLDGRPNPNWFWLVDSDLRKEISRLESKGGVSDAAQSFTEDIVRASHFVYRSGRNQLAEELHLTQLEGGVGGSRSGIKCLHAHAAYYLAGGWSPIGAWTIMKVLASHDVRI